jgi:hypothetical protein
MYSLLRLVLARCLSSPVFRCRGMESCAAGAGGATAALLLAPRAVAAAGSTMCSASSSSRSGRRHQQLVRWQFGCSPVQSLIKQPATSCSSAFAATAARCIHFYNPPYPAKHTPADLLVCTASPTCCLCGQQCCMVLCHTHAVQHFEPCPAISLPAKSCLVQCCSPLVIHKAWEELGTCSSGVQCSNCSAATAFSGRQNMLCGCHFTKPGKNLAPAAHRIAGLDL